MNFESSTPTEPEHNGSWLRNARRKKGLHQHQLAAKLDINQGRVSEWESGQNPIPPALLAEIESLLN